MADIEPLFGANSVRSLKQGESLIDVMQDVLSRPEELFPSLMVGLLVLLALERLGGVDEARPLLTGVTDARALGVSSGR